VKYCLIKEQGTMLHIDGSETPKSDYLLPFDFCRKRCRNNNICR
jgi:hypothetical protein